MPFVIRNLLLRIFFFENFAVVFGHFPASAEVCQTETTITYKLTDKQKSSTFNPGYRIGAINGELVHLAIQKDRDRFSDSPFWLLTNTYEELKRYALEPILKKL